MIDQDAISVELAQENAKKHHLTHFNLLQQNAWNLGIHEGYDTPTSNGFNIEFDNNKVTDLLTLSKESTWKNVNIDDALNKKLFLVILFTLHGKFFIQKTKHVNS